jgi:hypothetical protein
VTEKAFSDLPMSETILKACRNLVNFLTLHHRQPKSFLESRLREEPLNPFKM